MKIANEQFHSVSASPLSWPVSYKRAPAGKRKRANFGQKGDGYRMKRLTVAQARNRLMSEISAMTRVGRDWRVDPNDVVVSTNLRTRQDGLPFSNAAEPDDPGVAVYFMLDGEPHCLPCDKWDRVADNIAAIAAHIGAMRGIERWGVGDLKAAFAGFKALPPSSDVAQTYGIQDHESAAVFIATASRLRVSVEDVINSPEILRKAYRAAASRLHPDVGGNSETFAALQAAREIVLNARGNV